MPGSEPKLKRYQFRLRSLFVLLALVAFVLGLLMSSVPTRVAEEFHRVPDPMVAFDSMVVPGTDAANQDGWAFKMHCYAEKPFDLQVRHDSNGSVAGDHDSTQDVGLSMRSRSQLVGHNAVVDCELVFSGNCLQVYNTTDGERRLVGERRISDPRNIQWRGIPLAYLTHPKLRGWQRGHFLGDGVYLYVLECGVATKPHYSCAEGFSCGGRLLEGED